MQRSTQNDFRGVWWGMIRYDEILISQIEWWEIKRGRTKKFKAMKLVKVCWGMVRHACCGKRNWKQTTKFAEACGVMRDSEVGWSMMGYDREWWGLMKADGAWWGTRSLPMQQLRTPPAGPCFGTNHGSRGHLYSGNNIEDNWETNTKCKWQTSRDYGKSLWNRTCWQAGDNWETNGFKWKTSLEPGKIMLEKDLCANRIRKDTRGKQSCAFEDEIFMKEEKSLGDKWEISQRNQGGTGRL